MNLALNLSTSMLCLSGLVALAVLSMAAWRAPWLALQRVGARQHLWLGSMVILGTIGVLIRVSAFDLFYLHPLLIASVTLVFGWHLAVLAGFGGLLLMHVFGGLPWANLPFDFLAAVAAPSAAVRLLLMLIAWSRIRNLFLYTLGGGFFGGILSMAVCGISSLLLLWLSQPPQMPQVWDNAYLFLLLMFPEGFINGTIVSTMAVLSPDLVKTYDDDFYLSRDDRKS